MFCSRRQNVYLCVQVKDRHGNSMSSSTEEVRFCCRGPAFLSFELVENLHHSNGGALSKDESSNHDCYNAPDG